MCLVEKHRERGKKKNTLLLIIFINGSGARAPFFQMLQNCKGAGRVGGRALGRGAALLPAGGWPGCSSCCRSCALERVLPSTALASRPGQDHSKPAAKSFRKPREAHCALESHNFFFFWKLTSLLEQRAPFALLKRRSRCVALLL